MSLPAVFIEMFVRGAAGRVAAAHGCIVLVGTFVLLSLGSPPAIQNAAGQQTVQQFRYPATAGGKSGLRLTVERPMYPACDNLIDGIRVRVETADRRPARRRRELAVRLGLRVRWRDDIAVRVPIVLAEGESEVVFDVPVRVPLATSWGGNRLMVLENGTAIAELCDSRIPIEGSGTARVGDHNFSLLVIDRDVQVTLVQPGNASGRAASVSTSTIAGVGGDGELLCVDGLVWALDAPEAVRQGYTAVRSEQPWNLKSARTWYSPGRQLTNLRAAAVHPHYAMTDWRWYTEWSMVALSRDELAYLASSQPALFEALRHWVAMGGVLLVTGDDIGSLQAELARRFGLSTRGWRSPESDPQLRRLAPNWRIPQPFSSRSFSGNTFINSRSSLGGIQPAGDTVDQIIGSVRWTADRWGAVVAADRQSLARSALPWIWLMQTLPLNGASLEGQTTADMWGESAHYGHEWIGDAQQASIPFFLLLVFSFLLVIGPVNLIWAYHRREPVRALLAAPVIAAVTLAAFMMTVVVTEGIRTRTRVCAVTWLDADRGEACSWSHQSYYALMAPARLTYPAGTRVTPFLPSRQNAYHYELRVGGDQTTIDGSFLQSRSLVQTCVGNFMRTSQRLSVRELPERRLRVRNRLGTHIELLVVRGRRGDWYLARDIKQGGEVRIEATSQAAVQEATTKILTFAEMPDPAAGSSRSVGRSVRRVVPERVEWEMGRRLGQTACQPGRFLAIVEGSPFVSTGVSNGISTRNLELVIGSW